MDKGGVLRLKYSTSDTGAIGRHVGKLHPPVFNLSKKIKNKTRNLNELIDLIEREDTAAKNKGSKRIKANDTF